MVKVIGPDGRRWRIGRRWLAWRPRPSRALRACASAALTFADELTAALGFLAIAALIPLAMLHGLNWAGSLLATPVALFARRVLGRPWMVVAWSDDNREYRGKADGGRAADALVDRVRTDIDQYGEPKALIPPEPLAAQYLGTPREPVIDRAPAWIRRPVQWMLVQTGQTPPKVDK
jgi:hypothetical protein